MKQIFLYEFIVTVLVAFLLCGCEYSYSALKQTPTVNEEWKTSFPSFLTLLKDVVKKGVVPGEEEIMPRMSEQSGMDDYIVLTDGAGCIIDIHPPEGTCQSYVNNIFSGGNINWEVTLIEDVEDIPLLQSNYMTLTVKQDIMLQIYGTKDKSDIGLMWIEVPKTDILPKAGDRIKISGTLGSLEDREHNNQINGIGIVYYVDGDRKSKGVIIGIPDASVELHHSSSNETSKTSHIKKEKAVRLPDASTAITESSVGRNSKIPLIRLRSSYSDLSVVQLQSLSYFSIFRRPEWGLVGHSTIDNKFELKTLNGDKIVVDHATGLMWHQSGSLEDLYWKNKRWDDALEWMQKLNSKGYAGFYDWRLPTVEEAASLMESGESIEHYESELRIDKIFDKFQCSIWTVDHNGSDTVWKIDFKYGSIKPGLSIFHSFVRPVRTMD